MYSHKSHTEEKTEIKSFFTLTCANQKKILAHQSNLTYQLKVKSYRWTFGTVNMQSLSHLIRESIPNYFRDLPVPDSFVGIFQLGFSDLVRLTPLIAVISGSTYYTVRYLRGPSDASDGSSSAPIKRGGKVNLNIKKDNPKVVDTCDIEEIGSKKVFCRCWRSKTFPHCDGSHTEHNQVTGDNVGPLIIKSSG